MPCDGPDPPPPVNLADKRHPEALIISKPWRCSSSGSSHGAAEAAATTQQYGHDEASHCSSQRRLAHAMGQLRLNVTATQQPNGAAATTLTMDDASPCVLCRKPSGSTSPARPNAAGSAVGRAECGSRPVGQGRRVLMLNTLVQSNESVSRGQSQEGLVTTPPPTHTHTTTTTTTTSPKSVVV